MTVPLSATPKNGVAVFSISLYGKTLSIQIGYLVKK
jgi:hypothetical protein